MFGLFSVQYSHLFYFTLKVYLYVYTRRFPGVSDGKEPAAVQEACSAKRPALSLFHFKFAAVVQFFSHIPDVTSLSVAPQTAARQASLSFTISRSLLKLMFVESVMPSRHLILCWSLLLLPSVFPRIRVFSISRLFESGGQSIGASPSTSVLPMKIQDCFPSGLTSLISLKSKGLSSLLQHHSSEASILWCSAAFMV